MTNEELMRRYLENKDVEDTLEKLYAQNTGLIHTIAKDAASAFHGIHYESDGNGYTDYTRLLLDDLLGEGTLAMFQKIRERDYDETKGKFSTYIYPYIKGALYRYLEQNTGNISLTKDQSEALRKAQAMYAEGYAVEDIATELGTPKNITAELIRHNMQFLSFYDFVPEEQREEDGDCDPFAFMTLAEDPTIPPDRIVYRKIQLELLKPLFDSLSAHDRYLLGHYYGPYGMEKKTLDEMGLDLMLTVDGVRKAIKVAMKNLRSAYKDSELKIWNDTYAMVNKVQKNVG